MQVETIAIIGAGGAGREIARSAAACGYRTILEDVSAARLEEAAADVRRSVEPGGDLRTAHSVEEACREADLVIETTPQEMETKLEIFTLLDKFAKPGAIFASHGTLLPIAEVADITFRRDKCIGMHFAGVVEGSQLLEIARTPETSDDTVETCRAVGLRMGKEVVVMRESPGLLSARVDAWITNEAFCLLEEGVASAAEIDRALRLVLNRTVGPLEQADREGLDARLAALELLHTRLGEKFRPSSLLCRYVRERRLGRKSGRGVYEYPAAALGESAGPNEKSTGD